MTADNLKRAYELIRENRKGEARDILIPLCKTQTDYLDAWWLLSYAVEEPEHIRDTLEHVLRLDPDHAKARARLAALSNRPPKQGRSGGWGLRLALIGVVGLVVAVGVIYLFLLQSDETPRGAVVVNALPTLNPLGEAEAALTEIAAMRAGGSTPTPLLRGTLPPTWTPSPTSSASPIPTITLTDLPPILPTRTIAFDPNTLPTLEPLEVASSQNTSDDSAPQNASIIAAEDITEELLESTYWYGDGTRSMEDVQIDGSYRRHFRIPVRVWVDSTANADWVSTIETAIAEVNTVIPLQRVEVENEADIQIYVIHDSSIYETYCSPQSTGCAFIDINPDKDSQFLLIEAWVRVREDTEPTPTLIAHELIHALGVIVHSPDPADIMYPEYSADTSFTLSARDRLVLQILYALPALGAEYAPPE